MRKMVIGLFTFILFMPLVSAEDKVKATLSKCVDGDTAWFLIDGENTKMRFLAIDTPESTNKIEEYGKEASEYTCSMLTNAKVIEIEYDENASGTDKYGRDLGWIFVDGELLQKKIIESGLGKIAYLYDDYKYTSILEEAESQAKENKVGMWSDVTTTKLPSYLYIIIGGAVLAILCIFSKSIRNKVVRKTKSTIKSNIKKAYKNL